MAPFNVVSIGYERRDIDEFVMLLKDRQVSKLIDVREYPISRRRGFSKTRLAEALESAGIEYKHHRAAGNPHRRDTDSVTDCLKLYRGYLHRNPEVVHEIADELNGGRVAFLCFERSHACCHRSILLEELEQVGYTLEVLRLE